MPYQNTPLNIGFESTTMTIKELSGLITSTKVLFIKLSILTSPINGAIGTYDRGIGYLTAYGEPALPIKPFSPQSYIPDNPGAST
jgi:hypothetical protein